MKCSKCGEDIAVGFRFCRVCGTPVSAEYTPDSEREDLSEEIPGAEKIFADPGERLVGVLGREYLESYLEGNGLKRGFIAVSDRRVYQKGRSYVVRSGRTRSLRTKGSTVVDLADITGTRIISAADMIRLVLSALLFVCAVGMLLFAIFAGGAELFYYISGGLALLSLLSLMGHLISRRSLVTIMFGSGGISFDRKWFAKEEFYEFQRQLYLAKDRLLVKKYGDRLRTGGAQSNEER